MLSTGKQLRDLDGEERDGLEVIDVVWKCTWFTSRLEKPGLFRGAAALALGGLGPLYRFDVWKERGRNAPL